MHSLSIRTCLSFAWRTFKSRPWFFVSVTALVLLISQVLRFVQTADTGVPGAVQGLFFLASWVVDVFIGIGMLNLFLRAHDSAHAAHLRDLWHPRPAWKYLGLMVILLVVALVIFGFFALIGYGYVSLVPAASELVLTYAFAAMLAVATAVAYLVSIPFIFAPFMVVDQEVGPVAAIKGSWKLSRPVLGKLLGLLVIVAVINALGALALFVGLLVSVPVSALALTHAYRLLTRGTLPADA